MKQIIGKHMRDRIAEAMEESERFGVDELVEALNKRHIVLVDWLDMEGNGRGYELR